MKKYIKSFSLLSILVVLFSTCYYNQSQFKDTDFTKAEITTEISAIEGGYGLVIWVDSKKYINLNAIPHVKGYKPFPDSVVAQKAADMIVAKLRDNIIPPYLSEEDVMALGLK